MIDYVTIASTGNASDFGDLTATKTRMGAASNSITGIFAGGNTGSNSNVVESVTIASTGNATDHGDLLATKQYLAGCSGSHGGIA